TWLTPIVSPRYLPFSIAPPDTTIVGRSHEAAPMMSDGVVLSQPHSSTTPSIGLARTDSSTSMLTRLRKSIAVGRTLVSPSEVTGNSNGTAPASQTPRLTCSAITRKCALHGVSSDHVLQMPIIGRPSNRSEGSVRPTQLRWIKPSLSRLANEALERNFLPANRDDIDFNRVYSIRALNASMGLCGLCEHRCVSISAQ